MTSAQLSPPGGAVIEFAEPAAVLGLPGILLADAQAGEAVEHAELAFAKALVDDRLGRAAGQASGLQIASAVCRARM